MVKVWDWITNKNKNTVRRPKMALRWRRGQNLGTMSNFSVSRPPRALIFRAGREKKNISVPSFFFLFFFLNFESVRRPLPGIPAFCSIFHADVRRVLTKLSLPLSLSPSSSFLDNADCKNQQKIVPSYENHEDESWIACVGIWVGMYILRALFIVFAHAHRFAHWTRTRNRENNHCALMSLVPGIKNSRLRNGFEFDRAQ